MSRALGAIAALLVGVAGCASTAYVPASSPCLAYVIESGGTRWMHDGVTYRSFSDAVAGSENATRLARRAARRGHAGGVLSWIGIVGVTATSARFVANGEPSTADTAVYVASVGLELAALWLFAGAHRDALDARLTYDNEHCR